MAITYTWTKKKLAVDHFSMVSQINCVLQGVDGERTETANFVTVFPEHLEEHVDAWTQERIDAHADSHKADLEAEVARRLAAPLE